MDFYQALLGRRPQHLASGGALGDFSGFSDQASNILPLPSVGISNFTGGVGGDALGALGSSISGGFKQLTHPNTFKPEMPTNNFQTQTPQNTFNPALQTNAFQAQAPHTNQVQYANDINQGQNNAVQSLMHLDDSFGTQSRLAQNAGQTLGAQQNLYGQQQGLADALLAQSRGQGPNPAQLQFRQNVDQNIAQQAGALASQRGINPAIAARLAAQQGATMNQQAAGQAAVLGAQQQLAAQQQLGSQQQLLGQNLLGQNATIANQGNLYGQAANTASALGSAANNFYGTASGANNAQNNALINASLGAQGINAGVAQQNANLGQQQQDLKAGVAAQNANLQQQGQQLQEGVAAQNAALAGQGQALKAGVAGSNADTQTKILGGLINAGGSIGAAALAHGGEVDSRSMQLAQALMGRGGSVPGKAKKAGDDSDNDTVPTALSPKEIVLPRSVTMAEDAPEKAAEFVAKLKGKDGAKGYGKILEKHRHLKKKMAELDDLVRRQAS